MNAFDRARETLRQTSLTDLFRRSITTCDCPDCYCRSKATVRPVNQEAPNMCIDCQRGVHDRPRS